MIDIVDQINRIHREVGNGRIEAREARTVLLRRTYDTTVEDVWDACTDATRIGRWFLPVSGDLSLGGTYQLEGNAGGKILKCEPPHLLRVTWEFEQNAPSEVEIRISPDDTGNATFELEHIGVDDPAKWGQFGPGAVGVGWDLALLGLGLHLTNTEAIANPEEWQRSPEAIDFVTQSSNAWGTAHQESGATKEDAAAAAQNTTAAYTGAPME